MVSGAAVVPERADPHAVRDNTDRSEQLSKRRGANMTTWYGPRTVHLAYSDQNEVSEKARRVQLTSTRPDPRLITSLPGMRRIAAVTAAVLALAACGGGEAGTSTTPTADAATPAGDSGIDRTSALSTLATAPATAPIAPCPEQGLRNLDLYYGADNDGGIVGFNRETGTACSGGFGVVVWSSVVADHVTLLVEVTGSLEYIGTYGPDEDHLTALVLAGADEALAAALLLAAGIGRPDPEGTTTTMYQGTATTASPIHLDIWEGVLASSTRGGCAAAGSAETTVTNSIGDQVTLVLEPSGQSETFCGDAALVLSGSGHSIGVFPSAPTMSGSWVYLLGQPDWSPIGEVEALQRFYAYLSERSAGLTVFAASLGSPTGFHLVAVLDDPTALDGDTVAGLVEGVHGAPVVDLDCTSPDWVLPICPEPFPQGIEGVFADWRHSEGSDTGIPDGGRYEGTQRTLTSTETTIIAEIVTMELRASGPLRTDYNPPSLECFDHSRVAGEPRKPEATSVTVRGNQGILCMGGSPLDDPMIEIRWNEPAECHLSSSGTDCYRAFAISVTRMKIEQNLDGSGMEFLLPGSDDFYPYLDLVSAIGQWRLIDLRSRPGVEPSPEGLMEKVQAAVAMGDTEGLNRLIPHAAWDNDELAGILADLSGSSNSLDVQPCEISGDHRARCTALAAGAPWEFRFWLQEVYEGSWLITSADGSYIGGG